MKRTQFLSDIPDANLSMIVKYLSNYNDVANLKKTGNELNQFIKNEIHSLPKISEMNPPGSKILISMNVLNIKYEDQYKESQFSRFSKNITLRIAPAEFVSSNGCNYVQFSFSSPDVYTKRMRKITLLFDFLKDTITIKYSIPITDIVFKEVPINLRIRYIQKVLNLYHLSKETDNLLFVNLKTDNSLEIIVTSKLERILGGVVIKR